MPKKLPTLSQPHHEDLLHISSEISSLAPPGSEANRNTPTPLPRHRRRLQVQANRRNRLQSGLSLDIPRTRPSKRRRLATGTPPKTTKKVSSQAPQASANYSSSDCQCEPVSMDTQQLTSTDGPVREVPEPEVEVSWVADGVDGNDGGPTDLEAGLMLLEANHRATLARMRENIEIGDRRQEQLEQKLQEVCPSWIDDSSAVQQQWHELESESEEFHKRDERERSSLGLAMEDKSNHLVGTYSPILKCSSSGDDQLSFETSRGEDLRLLGLFNDLTVGCHIRPETEKIQTLPAIPLLHPTRTAQHHKPKTPQSVSTSSKQSTRSNSLDSLYDLYNPTSLSLSKQFGPIIITREQMGPETGQWVTVREGENSYHDHRPLQETNSDVSELDITTCTPAKHWASSTRQATCGKAIHDDYNDDEVTPKAQRMHPTCWEYTRDTNNDTGLDADRDRRVSEEKERESDGLRALSASVDLDGEGGVSLLLAEDPKG